MANNTRQIKRQIKSIKNTSKITRAMEMISAVKLQRAQTLALASRAYAALARDILQKLASGIEAEEHPFFAERPLKNASVIILSSNRGLCGSLNGNILKTVFEYEKNLKESAPEVSIRYITMGRKIRDILARFGKTLVADFQKPDVAVSSAPIIAVAKMVVEEFLGKKTDRVSIIFPEAITVMTQKPKVLELLPLSGELAEKAALVSYIFEPSKERVLNEALARLLEAQIYQALLETNASEHAARMVAMKNATDSAKDLVDDLTLFYNRGRQAVITQEVSEITAGRLALEN